jgi:perosamine synthetase
MDPEQVAGRLTRRTKAIMVVHVYGHPVEMDPILEIAEKHGLKIVEDAAEAHGARYRGRICGSFGDASAFSFYSNKIVATGEGGMVLCDSEAVAEDCRNYRNLYFDRSYRFLHGRLGHNFRLTNIQAAIGCAQVERLPEALERKAGMARLYDALLTDVPDLQLPPRTEHCENVHWVYGVVPGDSYAFEADALQERLRDEGVDSRRFFLGMHEQPVARDSGYGVGEGYPVTERLSRRGLYLPSGLSITEEQIETVVGALRRCLGHG